MRAPNLILIMSDQHRWDSTGYAGNPDVRTPNLDALAKHGLNFSQALCQFPAGPPSRATLMTGQHPAKHGIYGHGQGLPISTPTLPGLLQVAGYNTAAVGSMQFTPTRADYGFDFMALAEQAEPGRSEDDYHKWLEELGAFDQTGHWDQSGRDSAPKRYWDTFGAIASALPAPLHSTTWIGDQAVRFLRSAQEPFFLWTGFIKPHHPFDPPKPWSDMYKPNRLTLPEGFRLPPPKHKGTAPPLFDLSSMSETAFRKVLAYYYASISFVDSQIGRILATLAGRGHTNNVIVYCADHGDYMGQHGLILKDAGPPLDSLIRVPLVISGIIGQRMGETEPALAELTDVLPTLLDIANVPIPKKIQGRSLAPLLKDREADLRPAAYSEADQGRRIVRTASHKLVQAQDEGESAFYDLRNDPHEFTNRLGHPQTVSQQVGLTKILRRFR